MLVLYRTKFRRFSIVTVFVVCLMLTVPHFLATRNSAYKLAVATAHQSPVFRQALGPPISESWFFEGKWVWNTTADMRIPVRGQIRSGKLRARD